MKLLMENFKKYLNEIGDLSVEPYPFTLDQVYKEDGEVFYGFTTDAGSKYSVGFAKDIGPPDEIPWSITFDVEDSIEMTHENQPLKIMSTIVEVIKEFIASPDLNQGDLKFVFEGIPKPEDTDTDTGWDPFSSTRDIPTSTQTGRTKLYLKFLKKNLPEFWRYKIAGENVIFFGDHKFWD